MSTLRELAEALADGRVSARSVVERSLERIEDPAGEGERTFLQVSAEESRAMASSYDERRARGFPSPVFGGIPLAVKDLFDVEGQVTTAGSVVLADQTPATADAVAIARLRRAGFIMIGRTNMTEFAYSGLGLNAHFGTPSAALDRETGRIPGGSSSGSAVAVADGMAVIGLGTDTGGSCRIPAAFNGVVGFKPTARRIPRDGCFPLSFSLDSIGPMANSVDCCAIVDDLLAGGDGAVGTRQAPTDRLCLGVLSTLGFDGLDSEVAAAIEDALRQLSKSGIDLVDAPFPELNRLEEYYRGGGMLAAEAFSVHRQLLTDQGDAYDQRVRGRIALGEGISAADYVDMAKGRAEMIKAATKRMQGLSALILPTVSILPPPLTAYKTGDPGEDAAFYTKTNLSALRNTSIANFLDGCAISIPTGRGPVGLMLIGQPEADSDLLSVARTIEAVLRT